MEVQNEKSEKSDKSDKSENRVNTSTSGYSGDDKRKIINHTLDNLALSIFRGALLGSGIYLLTRSKALSLFGFSYMLGVSLRDSNDYILRNYHNKV